MRTGKEAEQTMRKAEIKKALQELPYAREDYWVLTGVAMVLYGFRDETADIDLGCSERMAAALERDGFLYRITESGRRWFRCGEHLEIFENWLKDSVTLVEGFPVITVRALIEMKQELGREKDLRDIQLIREKMKQAAAAPAGETSQA